MKSPCPFCSKRYSSSTNFDKHLRTTHLFEADEWLGNQFLLLERDQEIFDDTHDSSEGIHDSYSDAHDDSNSSESNSINYHNQDPDNNSDLESKSYFMMEEANGDANRHKAVRTIYESAGEHLYCSEDWDECSQNLHRYPWHPFNSAYEFRMARYFIRSKASQGNIDSFFLHALSSSGECFYRTGGGFIKRLEEMNYILGKASWHHSEVDIGGEKIPYYYRDPMVIVRCLLGPRAFRESLVYAPMVEHNEYGEKM
jgi:hypothetical protein